MFSYIFSCITSYGQTKYYLADGSPVPVSGEKSELVFGEKAKKNPNWPQPDRPAIAPLALIASLGPALFSLGYKITTNQLEKKAKRYTKEYTFRNSYIGKPEDIPSFEIKQAYKEKGKKDPTEAFKISFMPEVAGSGKTFYYYIEDFSAKRSGAKYDKNFFNSWLIEVAVNYYDSKEKKSQISAAIQVPFIKIPLDGENNPKYKINGHEFRTDNFPIGPNTFTTEVSVKLIESNAKKVKAEDISTMVSTTKDEARQLVNIIFKNLNEEPQDEDK
jgi:hypothetical protein